MTTLYEISAYLASLLADLDHATESESGEIPPDLDARMDRLGLEFSAKVDAVLRARVNYLATVEGVQTEIDRLTALRDAALRRAEWLRQYVFQSMMATGQQRLETRLFKLWIQRNGQPIVEIGDPVEFVRLHADLARVIPERREADRVAILERWRKWRAFQQQADDLHKLGQNEDANKAREAAQEVALPPGVRVVEGHHLRVR